MRQLIARLTGHIGYPGPSALDAINPDEFWKDHRVGVSQLNEMLLALAYETVTVDFFCRFFCKGRADAQDVGRDDFEAGVDAIEKVALLKYGNVKFGFKRLCRMTAEQLTEELKDLQPIEIETYVTRPVPLLSLRHIDP